jgi:hypothetical protein
MEPLHLDLWVRNYPTLNRNQQSGTGFKEKGLKNLHLWQTCLISFKAVKKNS